LGQGKFHQRLVDKNWSEKIKSYEIHGLRDLGFEKETLSQGKQGFHH
jgi:hypothetical protein